MHGKDLFPVGVGHKKICLRTIEKRGLDAGLCPFPCIKIHFLKYFKIFGY
jgi:hypothetical protein